MYRTIVETNTNCETKKALFDDSYWCNHFLKIKCNFIEMPYDLNENTLPEFVFKEGKLKQNLYENITMLSNMKWRTFLFFSLHRTWQFLSALSISLSTLCTVSMSNRNRGHIIFHYLIHMVFNYLSFTLFPIQEHHLLFCILSLYVSKIEMKLTLHYGHDNDNTHIPLSFIIQKSWL